MRGGGGGESSDISVGKEDTMRSGTIKVGPVGRKGEGTWNDERIIKTSKPGERKVLKPIFPKGEKNVGNRRRKRNDP